MAPHHRSCPFRTPCELPLNEFPFIGLVGPSIYSEQSRAGHSTSVSTRTCYPEKSASPSAPGSTTARVGLYFTLLGECELPGVIINHGLVLIIQYEMWC